MKISVLLLASILLFSFSNVKVNNSLNEYHLKGKIKCIKDYERYVMEGNDKMIYSRASWYDDKGNSISDTCFSNDTVFIKSRSSYIYNDKGIKTEENIFNADGSLSWKTIFTYDKSNRLIETNRAPLSGILMQRVVYKYDENGDNTLQLSYDGSGKPNGRTILKYDGRHALIDQEEYSTFFGDEALFYHFKYDSNEHIVTNLSYGEKGEFNRQTTLTDITLDKAGNLIKWTENTSHKKGSYKIIHKREIIYY